MFPKKYGFLIILRQEVYDWAGAMEDMPLHFTLHRGETLLTHHERVGPLDETLDLTERVSGGRILCSLISKLMELFYGQITEPRFCEKPKR